MSVAPSTLRKWSAEALNLALPPLKLATSWGIRIADFAMPSLPKPPGPPPRTTKPSRATRPKAGKRTTAVGRPAARNARARP
jgi:hypothetical protein